MKRCIVTTFPYAYWDMCARECVESIFKHWPEDVDVYIDTSDMQGHEYEEVYEHLTNAKSDDRKLFFIVNQTGEQAYFKQNFSDNPKDTYDKHAVKFSHKVFALAKFQEGMEFEGIYYDQIIYLDSDTITNTKVTHGDIDSFMPKIGQDVSYLGRLDMPHSELGFIGFNAKRFAEFVKRWVAFYHGASPEIYRLAGWTDCHAFDAIVKDFSGRNLSENIRGSHVWPETILGRYMSHNKGQRKKGKKYKEDEQKQVGVNPANAIIDMNNFKVPTRNAVDNQIIVDQIRENVGQIRNWVKICAPTDKKLAIFSAGPSLSYDEAKAAQNAGHKIICVKHAIKRLQEWGIKPWACVLLDPRQHVEGFVADPDPDVKYFVASMVHPSVVRHLNSKKCEVWGYHACVNAGEAAALIPNDMLVLGGSATATRSIDLFGRVMGFKNMDLHGYDLCYENPPAGIEKNPDGTPKQIFQTTLKTTTWGNAETHRTFWTEGQFMAQAVELRGYLNDPTLNIRIFGGGIGGWTYRHHRLYNEYVKKTKALIEQKSLNNFTALEMIDGGN